MALAVPAARLCENCQFWRLQFGLWPWLASENAASRAQGQLATQVSHMRGGAQHVLDSFCGLYAKEARQVAWHAHHRLGGQMLVEAAFVALPQPNGAQVGSPLRQQAAGAASSLACMLPCTPPATLPFTVALEEQLQDCLQASISEGRPC